MYSRRFYSSQQTKNTPVIQAVPVKKAPVVQLSPDDTRPRWPHTEVGEIVTEDFYIEPRDFSPSSSIPDTETVLEVSTESKVDTADENISEKMKNMTFEDMMLTWLALLSSSGEYDDEILLILGLILMIGA